MIQTIQISPGYANVGDERKEWRRLLWAKNLEQVFPWRPPEPGIMNHIEVHGWGRFVSTKQYMRGWQGGLVEEADFHTTKSTDGYTSKWTPCEPVYSQETLDFMEMLGFVRSDAQRWITPTLYRMMKGDCWVFGEEPVDPCKADGMGHVVDWAVNNPTAALLGAVSQLDIRKEDGLDTHNATLNVPSNRIGLFNAPHYRMMCMTLQDGKQFLFARDGQGVTVSRYFRPSNKW